MPTDLELYIYRNTVLMNIMTEAEAARHIAEHFNLSFDSVRGRLSRANTSENHTHLLEFIAQNPPDIAPSVVRQIEVIDKSEEILAAKLTGGTKSLVFLSDMHLPYTRWDAYLLAMQLLEAVNPDFVVGGSDLRDNKGYSKWYDDRPARGRILTSDVANIKAMELLHYQRLQPYTILHLMGNHDRWWYTNQRENNEQNAEHEIADYMEWLFDRNVLQFSRGWEENHIVLNEGLVIWHGQFTNKNYTTLAKNNLQHFQHVLQDGKVRSVICGHTHRPVRVEGSHIGYPTATFVNSGALTNYTPYLRRHPHSHGLGIVIAYFDPSSRDHKIDDIVFTQRGDYLVARYEGTEYATPLNEEAPREYL